MNGVVMRPLRLLRRLALALLLGAVSGPPAAALVGATPDSRFADRVAMVLMRGSGATCSVETGYLYPAPNSVFDLHYSIRTEGHYFAARDNQTLEILDNRRRREVRSMPLTNAFFYPTFVTDTLHRLAHGEQPIAGLADMAEAMDLVEAAYATSPLTQPGRRSQRHDGC